MPAGARRLAGDHQALARHAARHLGRRRALSRAVLDRTCRTSTCAGDNARCDEDGYYWIMGRIDDVLNVSGHRLSTIEIESALVSHPAVAEAAAVGRPARHQGRGRGRVRHAQQRVEPTEELREGVEEPRPQGDRRAGRSPTTSASPPRCPRPAAARSCAACSATSPAAKRPSATPRRWKTTACWPSLRTRRGICTGMILDGRRPACRPDSRE